MTGVTNAADAGAVIPPRIAGDSLSSLAEEAQAKMQKTAQSATPAAPVAPATSAADDTRQVPEISDVHYPGESIDIESLKPPSVIALLEWVARILTEHPQAALDLQARAGSHRAVDLLT
jgi:hypothetical protein